MNNKITSKQMIPTIMLFLTGSSLITGSYSSAGRDTWFCIIAAFLLVIPMIAVHSAILNLYPGHDYYANIMTACGKWCGKIFALFYCFCSIHLAAIVLRDFCEFIHIVNMVETPVYVIAAFILGVAAYLLKKGVYVLARVSRFSMPFVAASVLLTSLLATKDMEFSNIQPMFQSDPASLFRGIMLIFSLPLGEITACSSMFKYMDPKEKVFPVFFRGVFWATLLLLTANLRNLFILGETAAIFLYPSYEAVSVIAFGQFFTRIEVLIGINLTLAGFIKGCVLVFNACEAAATVFNLNRNSSRSYVPLIVPCILLVFTSVSAVYSSTEEMSHWMEYVPILSAPCQLLIPLTVLTAGKIRKRLSGGGRKGAKPHPGPSRQPEA